MRKLLLLSLLTAFTFGAAFGQATQPEKRFQVGVIVGKTFVGSYQEKIFLINANGGFAGIDLGYTFIERNQNVSLRLQPNWESFGQKIQILYDGTSTVKFSSVNIPILLRFSAPVKSWVHPFFEVGLGYKIRLKYSHELKVQGCGIASCFDEVSSSSLASGNKNGTTLSLGIGAEFRWGAVKIPVSVRLNEGIGNYEMEGVNLRGGDFAYSNPETRTLQVVTGITF